ALLLPALALAKQTAVSLSCLANLRSQGQMLYEYTTSYDDMIPFCWDNGGTNDHYGTNSYDTLLYCNNQGISPTAFTNAGVAWASSISLTQFEAMMAQFQKLFFCPDNAIPAANWQKWYPPAYYSTYGCNPNFFYLYNPTVSGQYPYIQTATFRLGDIGDAAEKLAIGDETQRTSIGLPLQTSFSYGQNNNPGSLLQYPSNYLVPPAGFEAFNANADYPETQFSLGLRYRHGENAPNTGWANALYFDGHAESVQINHSYTGAPRNAPYALGTTGLRVINLTNSKLPNDIYCPG
ncbi:MAG: hypothetical protein HKL96_07450, partial [Phycisphaerales bacterium]|nr:hypothetical protein [Phycisphaerales bacterium]